MAQRALRPNLPFHAPLQTRARKNLFVTTCPFDSNPGMRVATTKRGGFPWKKILSYMAVSATIIQGHG
ncbi:uncharacterized protein CCOS01_00958 [Colletotrichum costaricense]|uniref:Uncharacterized protein n=1 Tax=Colletotrichum costaricense TaxID=1209916 RepID=A0AAJ0E8F8_9PEZI|nr:uncharacterized protein CCOS01_00958 [Colletotrichum costaricense]KAK1539644.1 hypothetical protein CCOS01_00958 [Colletotrichum costaricense]